MAAGFRGLLAWMMAWHAAEVARVAGTDSVYARNADTDQGVLPRAGIAEEVYLRS